MCNVYNTILGLLMCTHPPLHIYYTHSPSLQTHTMQHTPTMYCLELSENGKDVYMNKCDGSPSQEWVWARHYTPKRTVRQWY